MIIRRLGELEPDKTIEAQNWVSRRLLLRDDGMGFSMHDTLIKAGTETRMHYKNHLEAVYCIEGAGSIKPVNSDDEVMLEPGTLYALDKHDEHVLKARSQLRMVCVFNPPVVGTETHDESGAYPLVE